MTVQIADTTSAPKTVVQSGANRKEAVSVVNGNLVLDESMLQDLSPQEVIAKILTFLREYKGALNDSLIKLMEIADEMGIATLEDQIQQADKAEKGRVIEKIMNGLGIGMAIFSVVLAVIIPTPLTIGMAVFSVGMLADQTISAALGQESLMSKGISKMTEGLMAAANAIVEKLVEANMISEEKAKAFKYAFATAIALVAVALVVVASKGAGAMVSKMMASVSQSAAKAVPGAATAVAGSTARGGAQSLGSFINANKERLFDVATQFQGITALTDSGFQVASSAIQMKIGNLTFEIDVRTGELALIDTQTNLLLQDFDVVGNRMDSLFKQSSQMVYA